MSHEVERRTLSRYLEEHNLKQTKQRDAILDIFLAATGHVTSEEIFNRVRKEHPNIGYTTVPDMKCFRRGVGLGASFRDAITLRIGTSTTTIWLHALRQDSSSSARANPQTNCRPLHFRVLRHRHELYGHCENCRADDGGSRGRVES